MCLRLLKKGETLSMIIRLIPLSLAVIAAGMFSSCGSKTPQENQQPSPEQVPSLEEAPSLDPVPVSSVQSALVKPGRLPLVAVKKSKTGTGSTEVHALDPPSFSKFLIQTGTKLHETDGNYDFKILDWDNDKVWDLMLVKKDGTPTFKTEVYAFSGATNFSTTILGSASKIPPVGTTQGVSFDFADWNNDHIPDLFVIYRWGSALGKTRVQILSGATGFKTDLLPSGTVDTDLDTSDERYDFVMTDWDLDGKPDLATIIKSGTGSGRTEVHIYSGASKFKTALVHEATSLRPTDDTFRFDFLDWNADGVMDLAVVKTQKTGTKTTELSILSGASGFKTALLDTGTALPETDETFAFAFPKQVRYKMQTILDAEDAHSDDGLIPTADQGDDVYEFNIPPYTMYDSYNLEVFYRTEAGRKTSDAYMNTVPTPGQRGGRLKFVVHWWHNGWEAVGYRLTVKVGSYADLRS